MLLKNLPHILNRKHISNLAIFLSARPCFSRVRNLYSILCRKTWRIGNGDFCISFVFFLNTALDAFNFRNREYTFSFLIRVFAFGKFVLNSSMNFFNDSIDSSCPLVMKEYRKYQNFDIWSSKESYTSLGNIC